MKILQEKLADAGFDVIDANVRSNWNPAEEDYAAIPEMVNALVAGGEADDQQTTEAEEPEVWVCDICNWEYTESEPMPDDFKCPICGAPKSKFHKK